MQTSITPPNDNEFLKFINFLENNIEEFYFSNTVEEEGKFLLICRKIEGDIYISLIKRVIVINDKTGEEEEKDILLDDLYCRKIYVLEDVITKNKKIIFEKNSTEILEVEMDKLLDNKLKLYKFLRQNKYRVMKNLYLYIFNDFLKGILNWARNTKTYYKEIFFIGNNNKEWIIPVNNDLKLSYNLQKTKTYQKIQNIYNYLRDVNKNFLQNFMRENQELINAFSSYLNKDIYSIIILSYILGVVLRLRDYKYTSLTPHLMVIGESEKGKTERIRLLLNKLFLFEEDFLTKDVLKGTGIRLLEEQYITLPLFVDEVTSMNEEFIDSFLKTISTGFIAEKRGTPNLDLTLTYYLIRPFIFTGNKEFESSNSSVIDRIINLHINENNYINFKEEIKILNKEIYKLGIYLHLKFSEFFKIFYEKFKDNFNYNNREEDKINFIRYGYEFLKIIFKDLNLNLSFKFDEVINYISDKTNIKQYYFLKSLLSKKITVNLENKTKVGSIYYFLNLLNEIGSQDLQWELNLRLTSEEPYIYIKEYKEELGIIITKKTLEEGLNSELSVTYVARLFNTEVKPYKLDKKRKVIKGIFLSWEAINKYYNYEEVEE